MIEPITKNMKEYLEWQDKYGVTKFIDDKTGEGHRGVIVQNNGTEAIVYGLTGKYVNQLVKIKEVNPDQWAITY
ncbi:MAG: hypothetical protein WC549_00410 [Actinomycetota bacterium]